MKVLIVAPHYDDEVIGCGGSLALHARRRDNTVVMYVTAGWSGLPHISSKKKAMQIRRQESKKACKILGVSKTIHLSIEDRGLVFNNKILCTFIAALRRVRAEIIYIPHSQDGDYEHQLVHQITNEAIWLASSNYLPQLGKKAPPVKQIFGYEVWTPISHYQLARDITGVVSKKEQALSAYQSQIQNTPWDEGILSLNRYRGVTSGEGKYVEVFEVLKIRNI